jgi:hypothetical protein
MASSPATRGCTGRQTSDGDCGWAHPLPIGGGGWTGGVAGEWRRRAGGGAAAGTRIPARTGAELVNVWHGQLLWDLADVLRGLVGSGIARRVELVGGSNGAAAGNCNPASRWNS